MGPLFQQVKSSLDEGIDELTQQLNTKEDLMKSRESLKNLRTLLDLIDKMEALLREKQGKFMFIFN